MAAVRAGLTSSCVACSGSGLSQLVIGSGLASPGMTYATCPLKRKRFGKPSVAGTYRGGRGCTPTHAEHHHRGLTNAHTWHGFIPLLPCNMVLWNKQSAPPHLKVQMPFSLLQNYARLICGAYNLQVRLGRFQSQRASAHSGIMARWMKLVVWWHGGVDAYNRSLRACRLCLAQSRDAQNAKRSDR